jgi:hypothetical protein
MGKANSENLCSLKKPLCMVLREAHEVRRDFRVYAIRGHFSTKTTDLRRIAAFLTKNAPFDQKRPKPVPSPFV